MKPWFALAALALVSAHESRTPTSTLTYEYRDDHDGRVVALVAARLQGTFLTVDLLPTGAPIDPPAGEEGFRGENVRTARELERHLEAGTLRVETPGTHGRLAVSGRGSFRTRAYDPALRRLVERPAELLRGVRYQAELLPGAPFRTTFRVWGSARLVLVGLEGRLDRFERPREDYGEIALAFVRRQEGETVKRLVRQLGDDSLDVRLEAEKKLVAMGKGVIPELEKYTTDGDAERRGRLLQVIEAIKRDEVVGRLTGPDPEERAKALRDLEALVGKDVLGHLRKYPDERTIPVLTDIILYETEEAPRIAAQDALFAIGTPKIYPALLWILRNPVEHGQKTVAWLGRNGDLTLVGELERLEKIPVPLAADVLEILRPRFPDGKAEPPKEWKPIDEAAIVEGVLAEQPAGRIRSIRAITTGLSFVPEAVKAVRGALKDSDEEVRFTAARALAWIGGESDAAALGETLRNAAEALRVRQMAAVALARTRSDAGRELLFGSFETSPPDLRVTLAGALGDSVGKPFLPKLEALLKKEENGAVRAALERAMQGIRARKS